MSAPTDPTKAPTPRPRGRRWWLAGLLCLLFGVTATLGFAWVPVVVDAWRHSAPGARSTHWDNPNSRWHERIGDETRYRGDWFHYAFSDFVNLFPADLREAESPWTRDEGFSLAELPEWVFQLSKDYTGARGEPIRWSTTAVGWPVRCLRGYALETYARSGVVIALTGRIDVSIGITTATLLYLPIWPGLLLNVATFTLAAALATLGVARLRRASRRRRGLCLRCAYPRTTGAHVCPECGATA